MPPQSQHSLFTVSLAKQRASSHMLQEKVCAHDAQKLLTSYKEKNTAFALAQGFHKDPSSLHYLSQENPAVFFLIGSMVFKLQDKDRNICNKICIPIFHVIFLI